jgi:Mg2+/Co2+ transporter CorC
MDEDREKVVGILLAKDLLRLAAQDRTSRRRAIRHQANSCARRCSCRNPSGLNVLLREIPPLARAHGRGGR